MKKHILISVTTLLLIFGSSFYNDVIAQEIDSIGCFEHTVFDVFVVDTLAYLTGGPSNVLMIVNVADPSNPILLGEHFWEGNT